MPAPSSLERLKDETAEETKRKLKGYRIEERGCRWVVVRNVPAYGDMDVKVSDDLTVVIDYLHRRLTRITDRFD